MCTLFVIAKTQIIIYRQITLIPWRDYKKMAMYCIVCGEELAPEEEDEGICQSCKLSQEQKVNDVEDIEPDLR